MAPSPAEGTLIHVTGQAAIARPRRQDTDRAGTKFSSLPKHAVGKRKMWAFKATDTVICLGEHVSWRSVPANQDAAKQTAHRWSGPAGAWAPPAFPVSSGSPRGSPVGLILGTPMSKPLNSEMCSHTHIHAYMHTLTCMHTYTHILTRTYTIYTHTLTHTYMHAYAHIHSCTHMRTHYFLTAVTYIKAFCRSLLQSSPSHRL